MFKKTTEAAAVIDWNDFVVVETIEFSEEPVSTTTPPPSMEISHPHSPHAADASDVSCNFSFSFVIFIFFSPFFFSFLLSRPWM
jgi:hypothetical protein